MMQYLTIKEASELAQVSRWTISRWVKTQHVRAVKFGSSIRIEVESLRAFLDAKMNDTIKAQS